MTLKPFLTMITLVLAILGVAIVTGSAVITILGCVAGLGFAVVVGATVFAAPPTPAPAPIAQETPVQPAGGSMHALLEQLYPDEPEPAVPTPLRLVDADTGELVGDRVLRLEERMTELTKEVVDLGAVVQDQAELTAKAFGTLRREVERIAHVFPETADA